MSNKDLDRSAEELSALMDGEVSELELRRVLGNVEQDDALADKWRRYQLASAALKRQTRGDASAWTGVDLSARVQQAIAEEPAVAVAPQRSSLVGWLNKPFANVAVAASVSAAVILGWQNLGGSPGVQTSPAVATNVSMAPVSVNAASPLMAVSQSNGSGAPATVLQPEMIRYNPELNDRLNYYLLSHSSNAALNTATGVTPYARVVNVKPAPQGTDTGAGR